MSNAIEWNSGGKHQGNMAIENCKYYSVPITKYQHGSCFKILLKIDSSQTNRARLEASQPNGDLELLKLFNSLTQNTANWQPYLWLLAYWVIFHAFLLSADLFQNQFFRKILSGIPSECQTVWIQIRPDIVSGLLCVQTVCKGFQQMTLHVVGKELNMYFGWSDGSTVAQW